jgi:serine/threonine protein phosphatase PrpC
VSEERPAIARWTSSAASRCGPQHTLNEDNYAEIEALGVFVVADGVGGYADGEVASGAVVGILDEILVADDDLETRVHVVEEAMRSVSSALWLASRQRPDQSPVATTVAALLLADRLAACIWAGDSRIYLHRDGHLYQLTRDHNMAVEFGTIGRNGGQLTRAVGSSESLDLDRVVTEARAGDMFLLCTDGVTKVMDDDELARFLEDPIEGLAPRLIGAIVERGGRDDATAIVVRYEGEF